MKQFFFASISLFFANSMVVRRFVGTVNFKQSVFLLQFRMVVYVVSFSFFCISRCASFKFNLKESFVTNCTILYSTSNKELCEIVARKSSIAYASTFQSQDEI